VSDEERELEPPDAAAVPAPAAADAAPQAAPAPEAAAAPAPPRSRNSALARAYRIGRPVTGQVSAVIKGGYEVAFGAARGFCPHSQIDVHREDHPEQRVGQTYSFRITQIRRGGDDVVVSRRVLLEESRVEEAKAVRATLIEGAVMQGRVVGTAPFGAFVDLGAGVQGLVHISELAHQHVVAADQAVHAGDSVRVRILKLQDSGKISLSIRQAEPDPWDGIEQRVVPGTLVPGAVSRQAAFGVFVELAPGIEALAPASEMPPGDWREQLPVGTNRSWWVLSVDPRQRRVSVTPSGDAVPPLPELTVGATLSGRVQRFERHGLMIWLGPGRIGLLPHDPGPADRRRGVAVGQAIEVTVVELAADGHRIRLARPGAEPAAARPAAEPAAAPPPRREPRKAPAPPPPAEPPPTFGTSLADKLRDALARGGKS